MHLVCIPIHLNVPQEVHDILESMPGGVMLAGGSVRRHFLSQGPLHFTGQRAGFDYDFFFSSAEAFLKASWEVASNADYTLTHSTEWADTYDHVTGIIVQFIKLRWVSCAEEAFDEFDLTMGQWAYRGAYDKTEPGLLWASQAALQASHDRKLCIHHVTSPVSTLTRLARFQREGWEVTPQTYADVLHQAALRPESIDNDILVKGGSDSSTSR